MSFTNGNGSPTKPIPIDAHRRRSASDSESSESSCSPTTPYSSGASFPTPATGNPRVAPVSPSTSPILSYFFGQTSPKAPANSLPFRRNFGPPAIDEDDEAPASPQSPTKHARRASTAWAGSERFAQPPAATPEQHDRATGVLRRLSLGGAMARPQIPQFKNATSGEGMQRSATPPTLSSTPTPMNGTPRKTRRSNTINPGTQRPKRAPSPMGERILTGHFDSFH
ncbi:uncharacterized protein B0H18DRAFT_1087632 [Fomitopsis serialis]|uniref:uncharacterized protein n=1 Tax=Fomitopsis serialis TaxID=139415 RepID=UPI00200823D3|nr:uncharacterized protein B0H18DRAFT_1087632 [Neoantrodia serialis]KAH9915100.1 hypothetical protein B0H18DRAFT_1087632 [Neoantrodia serialis]